MLESEVEKVSVCNKPFKTLHGITNSVILHSKILENQFSLKGNAEGTYINLSESFKNNKSHMTTSKWNGKQNSMSQTNYDDLQILKKLYSIKTRRYYGKLEKK